jgi:hypothetical protein
LYNLYMRLSIKMVYLVYLIWCKTINRISTNWTRKFNYEPSI